MPEASTFGLFLVASLALTVTPGPAILYIVARSVEGGLRAGLASVLGVGVGGLMHVTAATIGLSALLASSAAAFSAVKWLGAAYLVWLGLQRILARDEAPAPVTIERERLPRVFLQAVIVDVLNPKVALFFLAFLPQFVDPSRGAAWVQIMVFGAAFVAVALFTDGLYALISSRAGGWLRRRSASSGVRRGQRYISGGVYLALGAATAVSGGGKD